MNNAMPGAAGGMGTTAARLRKLYTAAVYDIMDEMGLPNQCLDLNIKPLDRSMRIAGPAFTIAGGPDPRPREDDPRPPLLRQYQYFDLIAPGSVVVISAAGERQSGHWGELMSAAAKARGAIGVVVDGGIRDGNLLFAMTGWDVFARYLSPIESKLRYRVTAVAEPIAMSGSLSAQVRVNPGDWIFGDMDGVLVIPADKVERVLREAEGVRETEDKVRAEIRTGADVEAVRQKYGRL